MKDSISVIYHQKNDSPKYFEIKRSNIYWFFIGLPSLALFIFTIGLISLISAGSPLNFLKNYQQSANLRQIIEERENAEEKLQLALREMNDLKVALATSTKKSDVIPMPTIPSSEQPLPEQGPDIENKQGPIITSAGLASLSLFKPVQGQKDRTKPALMNLSGFNTTTTAELINFQFNIIPNIIDDSKVSGHIIVLMKNELAIQVYPALAFSRNDLQINYALGEPFSTQRFRPVEANFAKPRKPGNYSFLIYIFSRAGDLIHFQAVTMPVKL